ncbi:MAG: hypothetical protein J5374_10640 [Bacteroidales bacterium]|nr:hypothetical protein [Bacteroidales bacterium]
MIVLITYDLKQPGRNYTPLYEAIKSLGDWQHPLESVWFVEMDDNASLDEAVELLKQNADRNDLFYVVRITQYYQGWLSKSFWNWINSKVK